MRAAKKRKVEAAVQKLLSEPKNSAVLVFHGSAPRSRLSINQAMMTIESNREMPNRWHRFWYKVLLDWEWEKVDKEKQ